MLCKLFSLKYVFGVGTLYKLRVFCCFFAQNDHPFTRSKIKGSMDKMQCFQQLEKKRIGIDLKKVF